MINYKDSNRYEKVDWLKSCLFPRRGVDNKTCNNLAGILSMLAGQLPTNEFTKIYEYVCLHWNIPKDQAELDELKKAEKENDRSTDEEGTEVRELVKEG